MSDEEKDEEKDEEQEGEEDEESDVSDESEIVENWEEIETKEEVRKKNRKQAILENISNKEANLKNQANNVRKESETNNQAANKAAGQPTLAVKVNTKHIKSSALQQQQEEDTLLRSPIVCVLGHVDTGECCDHHQISFHPNPGELVSELAS